MYKKYNISNCKGITLISIILIIVILLILTSVSVKIFEDNETLKNTEISIDQTKYKIYKNEIDTIRNDILIEKNLNEMTSKKFMDRYEERLKSDDLFKESSITRENDENIKLITPEGYVFDIIEKETKYAGKR